MRNEDLLYTMAVAQLSKEAEEKLANGMAPGMAAQPQAPMPNPQNGGLLGNATAAAPMAQQPQMQPQQAQGSLTQQQPGPGPMSFSQGMDNAGQAALQGVVPGMGLPPGLFAAMGANMPGGQR